MEEGAGELEPINYVFVMTLGIIVVSVAIGVLYLIYQSGEGCRLIEDIINFVPGLQQAVANTYGGSPCQAGPNIVIN